MHWSWTSTVLLFLENRIAKDWPTLVYTKLWRHFLYWQYYHLAMVVHLSNLQLIPQRLFSQKGGLPVNKDQRYLIKNNRSNSIKINLSCLTISLLKHHFPCNTASQMPEKLLQYPCRQTVKLHSLSRPRVVVQLSLWCRHSEQPMAFWEWVFSLPYHVLYEAQCWAGLLANSGYSSLPSLW